MSTDEAEVERQAGVDMVPIVESFETNLGPADGAIGSFATTWGTTELPRYDPSRDGDECF
jgi:hypothetical protein